MERRAGIALVGSVVLALACSSGGSGGGGSANDAVISVANAPAIVAELVDGLFLAGQLDDLGDAPDASVALAVDQAAAIGAGSVEAEISVPPTTLPCDNGGTQTVKGDILTPALPSIGDQLTTTYVDCILDPGDPTLNGGLDIIVRNFDGDFDAGTFLSDLIITFVDFTLEEGSETTGYAGNISLSQDTRVADLLALSIGGGTLDLTQGSHRQHFQGFQIHLNQNVNTGEYELPVFVVNGQTTVFARGNFEASDFVGRVHFDVIQTLTGQLPDPPETGALLITGANAATIRVLPDGDDVTLSINEDGDTATDPVCCTMSWNALLANPPAACVATTAACEP